MPWTGTFIRAEHSDGAGERAHSGGGDVTHGRIERGVIEDIRRGRSERVGQFLGNAERFGNTEVMDVQRLAHETEW